MPTELLDGSGSGRKAYVNSAYRLQTCTVAFDPMEDAARQGKAYVASTGLITLTTAGASALLYLKNQDSARLMLLHRVCVSLGSSTGGSGDQQFTSTGNPTGGTLLSGASAATLSNLNVGIQTPPVALAYKGAEGTTQTGGSTRTIRLFRDGSHNIITAESVLPAGSSLAFTVTPKTGNTSMVVNILAYFSMLDS